MPETLAHLSSVSSAVVVGEYQGLGEPSWDTADGNRPSRAQVGSGDARILTPVVIGPSRQLRGDQETVTEATIFGGRIGCDVFRANDNPVLTEGRRYVFFVADVLNERGGTTPRLIAEWPVNADDIVSAPLEGEIKLIDIDRALNPPPSTPPPTATSRFRTIEFITHDVVAPISPRLNASGVWTGTEVIVWGGFDSYGADSHRRDGAAYDPIADTWRVIAPGPLTERARHLAVWTGAKMLIWGPRGKNYIEPPDGAAYDPATDTWREIADGPLSWAGDASGVWTGSEWVIASGTEHAMEVAAYDPVEDTWRQLPDLPEPDTASLTWTGTDLLAGTGSGVYRLTPGADDWVAPAGDEDGPYGELVWTGDAAIGFRDRYAPSAHLARWDAETSTTRAVLRPPHQVDGAAMVWADGKLLLLGSGLALDVGTSEWLLLGNAAGNPRQYGIRLWLGDRLFEWGGGTLGHVQPQAHLKGYVLIPEW